MRALFGSSGSVLICCSLLCAATAAAADLSAAGRWKTTDEKTGKPRSIMLIYEENGMLFGKVDRILDPGRVNRRCDKCTDDRKDKPLLGMVLIRSMKKKGDEYSGGDILDPDNGTVYRCKMRVTEHGAKLTVRGFIGVALIGRSQVWTREP